ncbi:MAG: hypothetical protein QM783_12850 [Phycisphaerales bacterium]
MSFLEEAGSMYLERLKLRLMLGVIVLFIASCVASCNEVRYFIWSKTTSAKLTGMHGARGGVAVSYSFDDDGTVRNEDDDVSADLIRNGSAAVPGDGTVTIQYIPGAADRSRVKGHNYAWLTIPLVITGVLATVFGVRFWIEFKDHERRSKATSELYRR